MLFFKKKPEPEPEELELPASEKFKDLNPKARRKRKEPVKPWGRKERIIVLSVILFTVLSSAILAFSSRDWKLPGLPRVTLPEINFEKTVIIENDRTIENDKILDIKNSGQEKLKAFKDITDDLTGTYGFYYYNLEDNLEFGNLQNEKFTAASLIKLPVIAAFYAEAEKGVISLNSKYTLKESDKVGGAGSLYYKPAGTVVTYKELIRLMGKQSDNTAFNIVRKLLGDKKINDQIIKIGMSDTSLEDNETTPYDIGLFFQKLWDDKIVNEKNKEEFLEFLTDTAFEKWLTAGVPENIRVAHKYGREVHVINDAGIIYAKKPFVLVILSKGVVDKEGDENFPKLVNLFYE